MRLITLVLCLACSIVPALAAAPETVRFKRIPTQFIAALAEPGATSGTGAETWGVWTADPGPRGVWLKNFPALQAAGGIAPANWTFNPNDWWLDENGLIMEQPTFPLAPGQYLVTGRRQATAILTIHPPDAEGRQAWELGNQATIYDVTHLKCRSARYTTDAGGSCSPEAANPALFPVMPGAVMPAVSGCKKLDYTVLFIIGVAWDDKKSAN